jgi:hypothetical protein
LIELVKIDLEYRWRQRRALIDGDQCEPSASGPLVEEYVARYPQFGTAGDLSIDLIVKEYRVRQQWGDRPTLRDFERRFPQRAATLRTLFAAIDRELAFEAAARGADDVPRDARGAAESQADSGSSQRRAVTDRRAPVELAGRYYRDKSTAARFAAVVSHSTPWARRRRTAAILVLLASLALTGLGAVVVSATLRDGEDRPRSYRPRSDEPVVTHYSKAR